jgi:hypothetical protein
LLQDINTRPILKGTGAVTFLVAIILSHNQISFLPWNIHLGLECRVAAGKDTNLILKCSIVELLLEVFSPMILCPIPTVDGIDDVLYRVLQGKR